MAIEIKLPSLGDNIPSGDVLEVKVREGDVIKKDQGILELETEKATVEVPSTHAGKVLKVHVSDGQTIKTGAPLVTLEETASSVPKGADKPPTPAAAKPAAKPAALARPTSAPEREEQRAEPAKSSDNGPKVAKPPAEKAAASKPVPNGGNAATSRPSPSRPAAPPPADDASDENAGDSHDFIPAGPSVRRFAREVGVDLSRVSGTGPGGRITREDVVSVVRTANEVARGRAVNGPGDAKSPVAEATEMDAFGPIRAEKMTRIRKTIAAKMAESWSTAPRVTNFDDADVTELERIRQASKEDYAADGVKLTSLPFVIKAVAMSLKKHPALNAALDLENERILYKHYVNIGVAVDSERGLVVPSLRNADRLSISEIARQVSTLAEQVRTGSFSLEDLRGSTFTISNLGAIGGTYSTPIINVPEVAILLIGRARKLPVVTDNDKIVARLMMPLSLAYDHRLVDGASAARFLNDVIGYLEAPSRLLLAL